MGNGKSKYKIVHNIVYSVKGGCGKTSFSLFLTLSNLFYDEKHDRFILGNGLNGAGLGGARDTVKSLDDENAENLPGRRKMHSGGVKDHDVSNYMLDLDFLGTILLDTVGIDEVGSLVTMPNIIFNGQKIYDMKEPNRAGTGVGEKYIIYSSYKEIDKEKFHVKRENTPLLKYDDFRYEIRNIQKDIELFSAMMNGDMEQLNMIYDMPPNSDGYTDAFLDEISNIINRKRKAGDPKEEVVLYLLFNSASTLHCNVEWLKRFRCTRYLPDLKYVFVHCNSNPNCNVIDRKTVDGLLSDSPDKRMKFYYYEFEYSSVISGFNDDPSKKKGTVYRLEDYLKEYGGSDIIV